MKIEFVPTAIAALCGACAVALGKPAMAFAAMHIELTCAATSATLLAGAAWIGLPRRAKLEIVPDRGAYSPSQSVGEWLEANHVDADRDPSSAAALIEAGLERQLEATSLRDARVDALFLCLLADGRSRTGRSELLEELSKVVTGPDPEGEAARFIERHGLRQDPDMIVLRDRISARHGTSASMFLAAVDNARRSGRYPSSAMTWLKHVDRGLWYAVSNLGRRAFHVEGLAAIAHYAAEVSDGCCSAKPRIEAAARSLLEILSDRQSVQAESVREAT